MKIYKLRADRHHFLNFYISPDEIEAKMGDYFLLDEPLWTSFWKPVEAMFRDDSDKKNVTLAPDITIWYTSNNLVLNQKAYDTLKEALQPYGEFLPVTCAGNPYWVLHTTKKTDTNAVDTKSSERTIDEGCFIDLKKLSFNEEAVKNLLIFQTSYSDYRNLYCTDPFKNLIENSGLEGLIFFEDLISII